MEKSISINAAPVTANPAVKETIQCPMMRGCGNGWTCDNCPNYGCPANERA